MAAKLTLSGLSLILSILYLRFLDNGRKILFMLDRCFQYNYKTGLVLFCIYLVSNLCLLAFILPTRKKTSMGNCVVQTP